MAGTKIILERRDFRELHPQGNSSGGFEALLVDLGLTLESQARGLHGCARHIQIEVSDGGAELSEGQVATLDQTIRDARGGCYVAS